MVSPKASLINDEFASFGLGAWYVPTPKAPTCMTLPESVPTSLVALLPKPTFIHPHQQSWPTLPH